MGRTLPSASILLMQEIEGYKTFQRALSPRDQRALEELFIFANRHVAEAQYTSFELPMVTFLLAMLLEEHKEVLRLKEEINAGNPARIFR